MERRAGGVPERPKGTGCKPVGSAFAGSNPASPIRPSGRLRRRDPREWQREGPRRCGVRGPLKRVMRRPLALRRRPAGRRATCRLASGRAPAAPAHLLRRALDAGPPGCRAAGRRLAGRGLTACRLAGRRLTACRLAGRRLAGCRLTACRLACRRLTRCRAACRRLATGCAGPLGCRAPRRTGLTCRSLSRSRHGSPPFTRAVWAV
jgi:hypothetical protein